MGWILRQYLNEVIGLHILSLSSSLFIFLTYLAAKSSAYGARFHGESSGELDMRRFDWHIFLECHWI